MARSTSFYFIPVPEPQFAKALTAEEEGTLPVDYSLARYVNGVYDFDHKFALVADPVSGHTAFQVLTKDASDEFTVADPENRFSIEDRFIKISLIDIYDDGSEYKFRLEEGTLTQPGNRVVLPSARRPDFVVTETVFTTETTQTSELNFIGSIDIRAGLTGRVQVVLSPGNSLELCAINGDLIFQH